MTKKIRSGLYKLDTYWIERNEYNGDWSVYSGGESLPNGERYDADWEITFGGTVDVEEGNVMDFADFISGYAK